MSNPKFGLPNNTDPMDASPLQFSYSKVNSSNCYLAPIYMNLKPHHCQILFLNRVSKVPKNYNLKPTDFLHNATTWNIVGLFKPSLKNTH